MSEEAIAIAVCGYFIAGPIVYTALNQIPHWTKWPWVDRTALVLCGPIAWELVVLLVFIGWEEERKLRRHGWYEERK